MPQRDRAVPARLAIHLHCDPVRCTPRSPDWLAPTAAAGRRLRRPRSMARNPEHLAKRVGQDRGTRSRSGAAVSMPEPTAPGGTRLGRRRGSRPAIQAFAVVSNTRVPAARTRVSPHGDFNDLRRRKMSSTPCLTSPTGPPPGTSSMPAPILGRCQRRIPMSGVQKYGPPGKLNLTTQLNPGDKTARSATGSANPDVWPDRGRPGSHLLQRRGRRKPCKTA